MNLADCANLKDPAALANGLRKVKYLYLMRAASPVRAASRCWGRKKIFDQKLVHLAWLYAERSGKGRRLIDLAYPRFFKREIDYEDRGAIDAPVEGGGCRSGGLRGFRGG